MNFFILSMVLVFSLTIGLIVVNYIVLVLLMEVTLFTFVFMMYNYKVLNYGAVCIKYFLVQSMASLLLLLSSLVFSGMDSGMVLWPTFMALVGVFVKLGAFPMYFWVVPVFKELPFLMLGVLAMPMKILPLVYLDAILNILFMPPHVLEFLMVAGAASMLTGMVLGLAATNLRAMLGASSITHTGWFFFAFYSSYIIEYFLLYTVTLSMLLWSLNYSSSLTISLSLFGLSGLPPFSVFFAKVLILSGLWTQNDVMFIFVVVALLSSVVSLFYYLKYSLYFFMQRLVWSKMSGSLLMLFFMVNVSSIYMLLLVFFYGRVWP